MQIQAPAERHNKLVAIAGNIGVGKTTFVSMYAKARHGHAVFEPYGANPFLDDFYGDMPRWGFATQIHFLTSRVRQLVALSAHTGLIVQDRSLYEDSEVFARNLHRQGHMSDREWDTYQQLYACLAGSLRAPDLIVYLRASVPTLQRRIAERDRAFERSIEASYLMSLNQLYEEWIAQCTTTRVVIFDADRQDFVADAAAFAELSALVDAALS